MSVARFIADQRTNYAVPHTTVCALLGVSEAWFYKWIKRADGPGAASGLFTDTDRRRDTVDRAVAVAFRKAKGLHGSPRLREDLREAGWRVSEKTVAESMRRQGLVAGVIKRRSGLTRQDRTAPKVLDLVRRDFTAPAPNYKWVGDITEIPTAEGKLYLATVIDLYSRRLLGPRPAPTPTLTWRARRSGWPSPLAAARRRSGVRTRPTASSSTPTGARPTRRPRSPGSAPTSGSASRWAGSARASTTPPPRRSSLPWSGKSCPGTSSTPGPRPGPSSSTGPTGSTTTNADTAPLA